MVDLYADYIRILGRGPIKSRHLTQTEAQAAFAGVLSGEMSDMQVGALLLLLRYRSESPAELAGIVTAMRRHMGAQATCEFENLIDWPSTSSGKSRRLPWFLLSAKLLSENGHKVFMHGFNSHLDNGLLTEDCLDAVGEKPAASLAAARHKLESENFVYLPLRNFSPKLQELLEIRSVLGVRSIVNTAVKLINPLAAKLTFLGIFHPAYITLNMDAAALIAQPSLGVIKGGGGEAERNVGKAIKLYQIKDGQQTVSKWPAMTPESPEYPVTVDYLSEIWRGVIQNDFASKMVIGTAAQALYLTGYATTVEQAEHLAGNYWQDHLSHAM